MFATVRDLHDAARRVVVDAKLNGRVVTVDESTVVVYDVAWWSDELSERVRASVPECSVRQQTSDSSLGFNLVLTLHDTAWGSWITALLVIAAGILITALKAPQLRWPAL